MGIDDMSTFRRWSIFPGPKGSEEPQQAQHERILDPGLRNGDGWRPKFKCTNKECTECDTVVEVDHCPVCHRNCELVRR